MPDANPHSDADWSWSGDRTWSSRPTPRDGNLFVYIALEKSGSNTFTNALESRAHQHGWASHAVSLRGHKGPFINTTLCYQEHLPEGCCVRSPNGTVVHDVRHGLCAYAGARTCRYLVLLREPIARAVSAYNFFCVACSQSNGHCDPPHTPACPNISIAHYVREATGHGPGRGPLLKLYSEHLGNRRGALEDGRLAAERERAFVRAKERLRNPDRLLAMPLEALGDAAMRAHVAHILGDNDPEAAAWTEWLGNHGNSFEREQLWRLRGSRAASRRALRTVASLTNGERHELNSILRHDIAIYRLAVASVRRAVGLPRGGAKAEHRLEALEGEPISQSRRR